MNTHLTSHIQTAGSLLFLDSSEHHLNICVEAFNISRANQSRVDFWTNVKTFFESNDVLKEKHKIKAPCNFIEDNPSAGRHRQHLYVNDKAGNSFQIYALSHKKETTLIDDCYSIAAVAQGLMANDLSGVHHWFSDFRDFALSNVKSAIKATLESMDDYPYSEKEQINKFLSCFFSSIEYRPTFDPDFKIENLHYEKMPNLSTLHAMSRNRWKKEIDVSDFKAELHNIYNQLP